MRSIGQPYGSTAMPDAYMRVPASYQQSPQLSSSSPPAAASFGGDTTSEFKEKSARGRRNLFRRVKDALNFWFNNAPDDVIPADSTFDICWWVLHGEDYRRRITLSKVILVVLLLVWWAWPRSVPPLCTPEMHLVEPCGSFVRPQGRLVYCAPDNQVLVDPRITAYHQLVDRVPSLYPLVKCSRHSKPETRDHIPISRFVRVQYGEQGEKSTELNMHMSNCLQQFFRHSPDSPIPYDCIEHL